MVNKYNKMSKRSDEIFNEYRAMYDKACMIKCSPKFINCCKYRINKDRTRIVVFFR